MEGTEDRLRRKQEELMGLSLSLLRHPSKADLPTNLFLGFTNGMVNYL